MHVTGGKFKGQTLICPKANVRPSSSQLKAALFNICQHFVEGAHFLDLFAGSGAVAIEALSRGAASAALVERSREALACIQKNLSKLGLQEVATVCGGDVFRWLPKLAQKGARFSLIFVDPPYERKEKGKSLAALTLALLDALPLLEPGGLLFVEAAKGDPLVPDGGLKTLALKATRHYGTTKLLEFSTRDL